MHNLKEIAIVHVRKDGVLATYFREFLKWIGFSYFDFTYNEKEEGLNNILEQDENKFDILLVFDEVPEEWRKRNNQNALIQIPIKREAIWESNSLKLKQEPLVNLWQQIYNNLNLNVKIQETINKLITVYCKYNLLHKLYSDKFNVCTADCDKELRKMHKNKIHAQYFSWIDAAEELQQYKESLFDKEETGKEYLDYAILFCCRKMNEIEELIKGRKIYDTSTLINLANEIYKSDATFYMVESLKSKITRNDNLYKLHTMSFNKNCVEQCTIKACNSFNYYRVGKYCEINGCEEQAVQEYKKSYELNPLNFRALFKLAVDRIKKKDIENARLSLKKVLLLLQIGENAEEEENFDNIIIQLKPLELEYAVKCFFLLGQLEADDYNNQVAGAKYFQKVIRVHVLMEKISFIEMMYPQQDEKEFMYCCLENRLKIGSIERKLRGCINTDMYKNWSKHYGKEWEERRKNNIN